MLTEGSYLYHFWICTVQTSVLTCWQLCRWELSHVKVEPVCSLTIEFRTITKIVTPSRLAWTRLANGGYELIDHILQEAVHHTRTPEYPSECRLCQKKVMSGQGVCQWSEYVWIEQWPLVAPRWCVWMSQMAQPKCELLYAETLWQNTIYVCSYQSASFLLQESLSACAKPATPCSNFENIFRASVLSSSLTLVAYVIPGRRHKIDSKQEYYSSATVPVKYCYS